MSLAEANMTLSDQTIADFLVVTSWGVGNMVVGTCVVEPWGFAQKCGRHHSIAISMEENFI